jgi:proteasome lid subunit RPN8/RPN11
MSFRLIVPRACYEEMIAQALAERPNECCGMLAGVRDEPGVARVVKVYPLVNALASPVEYLSDPQSTFAADRDQSRLGLDVLAIYHSHPTTQPIPSRKDLDRNYSEDVINFIISLAGEAPSVRGWWLTATEYREAEWTIA